MCYTCIIAFTGGLVGSEIIYLWLDPVIQSSNPVQRSSPQSSPAIRDGQKLAIVQFIIPSKEVHMEAHHGNNVSNFRYVFYN